MKKAAFLLILFSGFFLTSVAISPVYIAFILAMCFFSIQLLYQIGVKSKIPAEKTVMFAFFFFFFMIYFQIFLLGNWNHTVLNVLFSISYFVFTYYAIFNLSIWKICNLVKKMINITLPLLLFEALYRWTHPIYNELNDLNGISYYQYKYSSIMYQDSNFVGIYIVALFFLCSYMRRFWKVYMRKQQMVLFILVLLTLSKAAIVTTVLFGILFELELSKKKKFYCCVVIGIPGGMFFLRQIIFDHSLSGKLAIFMYTKDWWINTTLLHKLVGVGFGHAEEYIGMGAHNLLLTFIVESGALGVIVLLFFWFIILKSTNWRGIIVMLPFFVNGMSLAGHAIPWFYCMMAIICVLESCSCNRYFIDDFQKMSINLQ